MASATPNHNQPGGCVTVGMTTVAGGGPGEELQRYRLVGSKSNVSHFCADGVSYFPGDEVEAKPSVMAYQVANGHAVLIEPDEIRHDDPVAQHRDPVRRGRKTRRRA